MSLLSTVGIARTGAKSLRATVPEGIVAFLELAEGDKLDWRMDVQNMERLVIVRKVKQSAQPLEINAPKLSPSNPTTIRLRRKYSKSRNR
jgi:hypothetical protein